MHSIILGRVGSKMMSLLSVLSFWKMKYLPWDRWCNHTETRWQQNLKQWPRACRLQFPPWSKGKRNRGKLWARATRTHENQTCCVLSACFHEKDLSVLWDTEPTAGFYGWVLPCTKVCAWKQDPDSLWASVSRFLPCHLEQQDPLSWTSERIKKHTCPATCVSLNFSPDTSVTWQRCGEEMES